MPIELLKKCPPMYLTTAEWDHYRLDNEWFAERLKEAGKFLGLFIVPGDIHGEIPHKEVSVIFKHYL
jgi:acetyl esterase/lipase